MRLLPIPLVLAALMASADVPNKGRNATEGLYDPAVGILKRGSPDERTLVLTFDDGPHPESCERALDTLRELGVKATFFVVGERVKARPDLVRRMIAEGHEVGNHTQRHPRLDALPPERQADEMRFCATNVERATGRGMAFMRPPGMRFSPATLVKARALGYVVVGYNSAAGDYAPGPGLSDLTPEESEIYGLTPGSIAEKIERQLKPGTIILLHDNSVTLQAIPKIVAYARSQGYRFVTTAELMAGLPEPVKIVANPVVAR